MVGFMVWDKHKWKILQVTPTKQNNLIQVIKHTH